MVYLTEWGEAEPVRRETLRGDTITPRRGEPPIVMASYKCGHRIVWAGMPLSQKPPACCPKCMP